MGDLLVSGSTNPQVTPILNNLFERVDSSLSPLSAVPNANASGFHNSSSASIYSQPPREFRWKYFVGGVALVSASVISFAVGGSAATNCHSSPQECNGTAATGILLGAATFGGGVFCFIKSFR